jgi:hypothetical protein
MDPVPLNWCRNDGSADKPFSPFIQFSGTIHCPAGSLGYYLVLISLNEECKREQMKGVTCNPCLMEMLI